MSYINSDNIQKSLQNINGKEVSSYNILKIQEIENELNEYKKMLINEHFSQKRLISLDNFFYTMVSILGNNVIHYDNFFSYTDTMKYGNDSELYIPKSSKIHIVGSSDRWQINLNESNHHFTTILKQFQYLMEGNKDFLYYAPENEEFFTSIFKTDEEIILPFGNSMKYFPGDRQDDFRNAIRIATDHLSSNGIPLALRLK